MWSGVVPQQPPTIADAVALDELLAAVRRAARAPRGRSSRPRALVRDAGVRDAVDRQRRVLAEEADRVAHVLRAGRAVEPDHVDVERRSASSSTAWMSVPSSILPPFGSSDTELWIGSRLPVFLNASRAPKTAALTSRMSCAVSMMSRSAPPSIRPVGLLGEDLDQLAEADLAERRVVGGGQHAGRADRAGDEALLADRLAGDLGGLRVDLERVLAEAPLVELEPAGLEGVGLDHVAPASTIELWTPSITSGRFRTSASWHLPWQAAVVLLGQVELLEGRAHAAVEDDDLRRTVSRKSRIARAAPTLTRLCQGQDGLRTVSILARTVLFRALIAGILALAVAARPSPPIRAATSSGASR